MSIQKTQMWLSTILVALSAAIAANVNNTTISVTAVGGQETVLTQIELGQPNSTMCTLADWIDSPARAWRSADGVVRLITASNETYPLVGSSIDSLHKDCSSPIYKSVGSASQPGDYFATLDSEFPVAVYTLNGRDTYALVHNEWHGACDGNAWVNTITVLQSTNGGVNFSHPEDYQVRRVPTFWNDAFCTSGPVFGSFNPTNIIPKDGWYYSIFGSGRAPDGAGSQGPCLLRTQSLGSGSAWQVWTANGWQSSQNAIACQPLQGLTMDIIGGIVYSTYLQKYVAIYSSQRSSEAGTVYETVYSVSDDLFSWTSPTVLPVPGKFAYPSLLSTSNDPAVTGLNFENIGQDAWVYQIDLELPRKLVRQKIHFEQHPRAYVLGNDGNLWREQGDMNTRVQVDGTVKTFQAMNATLVYVLGTDGNLWREQGNSQNRQWVDGNVQAFQATDNNLVYVVGNDGKLWREQGDMNNRVLVDGNVKAFQAIDNTLVYVLGTDGNLWREQGNSANRQWVDGNVQAFQAIIDGTIYVLGTDSNLWFEQIGWQSTGRKWIDSNVRDFQHF